MRLTFLLSGFRRSRQDAGGGDGAAMIVGGSDAGGRDGPSFGNTPTVVSLSVQPSTAAVSTSGQKVTQAFQLVVKLSETLAEFVASRQWLAEDRARRITRDACEKATIALAAESMEGEVRPLVRHLRESGHRQRGVTTSPFG